MLETSSSSSVKAPLVLHVEALAGRFVRALGAKRHSADDSAHPGVLEAADQSSHCIGVEKHVGIRKEEDRAGGVGRTEVHGIGFAPPLRAPQEPQALAGRFGGEPIRVVVRAV